MNALSLVCAELNNLLFQKGTCLFIMASPFLTLSGIKERRRFIFVF